MNNLRRKELKQKMFMKQKGECYYCKTVMCLEYNREGPPIGNSATFEHVIPKSYGVEGLGNIVLACYQCNNSRGKELDDMLRYQVLSVSEEWEKWKDTTWDCGEGVVWLNDFLPGGWIENRHTDSQYFGIYKERVEAHIDTVEWWKKRLNKWKGRDQPISQKFAILCNRDKVIVDGFHRLTAAYILGLKSYPYKIEAHIDRLWI